MVRSLSHLELLIGNKTSASAENLTNGTPGKLYKFDVGLD